MGWEDTAMAKTAIRFYVEHLDVSDGTCTVEYVCVDRKVHLTHTLNRYEPSWLQGCPRESYHWEVFGPCDGSCSQVEIRLPGETVALLP